MLNDLLTNKYNVPVPRYTSYPPANFFHEGFKSEDLLVAIKESNDLQPANLSFYFHIPFCRHHCTYCGCNAYPMADETGISAYMEAMKKELRMVLPSLDHQRRISQIHFGGGSPTCIPVHYLEELIQVLTSEFSLTEKPEIAVECHPGYLTMSDWENLVKAGFNRCSIGVQDFDLNVLKAVNRKPSLEEISEVVSFLKSRNVSVNLDFIYGLPYQTPEKFAETIDLATALKPDRLVTFSYAHVPWVHPVQKALEKYGLPDSTLKSKLYEAACFILTSKGYHRIGMDHFVLPGDELDLASQNGKLHRNFQGYCTWETTGQVYAFGVTGISQLTSVYAQNTKSIPDYIRLVNEGILPVVKGYRLSDEEQLVREIIAGLMCNGTLQWTALAKRIGLDSAETLKNHLSYSEEKLEEMAEDGLISVSPDFVKITETGRRFVRNVATVFDPLYKTGSAGYSLPV
jgi:oxygen-independent coproporphyrinogen III oxidase